jgi:glycine/D-amino acid oxidase-like deaminating enzyme
MMVVCMRAPTSLWLSGQEDAPRPITEDGSYEVAIVGGGIVGISVAYHLRESGLRVCVLEAGTIGSGSTGMSGGFVTPSTTFDAYELIDEWGEARGTEIYASLRTAVREIGETVRRENIACGYNVCGAFYYAAEPSHFRRLAKEAATLTRMGILATLIPPGDAALPARGMFGALRTVDDAAMDPARFVRGVAQQIGNADLFTGTRVTEIDKQGNGYALKVQGGVTVRAERVVVATNSWSLADAVAGHAVPYASCIAIASSHEPFAHPAWHGELMWDTYGTYHYLRELPDGRILIGGEDDFFGPRHDATLSPQRASHLMHTLGTLFPSTRFEYQSGWRGSLAYPLDGLPVIHSRDGLHTLVTDGLPFGWLIGRVAAERIVSGRSDYDHLYDAGRDFGMLRNVLIRAPIPAAFKRLLLKIGVALYRVWYLLDESVKH